MQPQPSGSSPQHRCHLQQHQALDVDETEPPHRGSDVRVPNSAFLGPSASLSSLVLSPMLELVRVQETQGEKLYGLVQTPGSRCPWLL